MIMILAIHVIIGLIAILAGLVFVGARLRGRDQATDSFLATTMATSVSGFLIPFQHLLPSHIVGALSITALTVAYWARPQSPGLFTVTSLIAFYFNFMVLLVQIFKRLPSPLPTLEPAAQLTLFLAALAVGRSLLRRLPGTAAG